MSWLFSQALVEEYLGENSSGGEPSAPLSGSHTQLAYLPPDKMTAFSRLSQFGMMFKPLTESRGEALLMSFREAFPAKTSPSQEKETAWTESAAGCGTKWRGWLAKYDPSSSSWRTAQCSLLEEEPESLLTLPRSGMTRGGLLWELPMSERRTNATGFGLWRTPTVAMLNADRAKDSEYAAKKLAKGQTITLADQVKNKLMWPTPRTKGMCGGSGSWDLLNKNTTVEEARQMGAGNGGKLNPAWVEWLMGWPLGWTDLKPLEMDKSLSAPQQPGES